MTTDLWQHRLYFKRNDGQWEDIFVSGLEATCLLTLAHAGQIPFDNFILTNTGELVQHQITMFRERIRTVGISLLGGNSGVSGPYDLGIHSIRAVNEEDVTKPPCKRERRNDQGTTDVPSRARSVTQCMTSFSLTTRYAIHPVKWHIHLAYIYIQCNLHGLFRK